MNTLWKSLTILLMLTGFGLSAPAQQRDSLAELSRRIDILTQEIERLKLGAVDETIYESVGGLGPAASKVYTLKKTGVSLAGYGEVVYENYGTKRDDGSTATAKDQFDYLRNVMYVGFRFNDWVLFNSEVEFEHGSTGKGGEVSIELGYIDLLISHAVNVRAGMVLAPLGIVNEKHEPPTFFGTLRSGVERSIIPSTWRMNGAGLFGTLADGLDYRAYVVESLTMAKFTASDGIRGGRQSGARSTVEDLAVTGRVDYAGLPGATLGGGFFVGNTGQGAKDSVGKRIDARTMVFSVHGEYAWKGLELRALYAQTNVDEAERVSGYQRWTSNAAAAPVIGSSMTGWYVAAGYDLMPTLMKQSSHYLAPFVQYEAYNTHATVPAGMTASKAVDRTALVVGLTYKPHPNVAFKVDYRDNANAAKTATDQWNAAVTYMY